MRRIGWLSLLALVGCGGSIGSGVSDGGRSDAPRAPTDSGPPVDAYLEPPRASCGMGASPSSSVAMPTLLATLSDRYQEGWLGSPAIADLDGDGTNEIIVTRDGLLLAWHLDNTIVWRVEVDGRIWASPVVADLLPTSNGLEVAFASRAQIHLITANGSEAPGFPVMWIDELRSIAAGDINGDGVREIVVVTTNKLQANGQADVVLAVASDGTVLPGFPPNTTGASGCDDACYVTDGYDQNIALGDVNGDSAAEIFIGQDNAYLSLHEGNGRAFDAAPVFRNRTKFLGVRFLHDYTEAQMGYSDHEDTSLQAHFTNSAPAIADLDGDGRRDLVVLGSVQNAAQDQRTLGVGLWAIHPDGTRLEAWTAPFHVPEYLAGLSDLGGNIVGATNQLSIADLFPDREGPEIVFAGFDGRIHCVDARAQEIWATRYTTSDQVLTGGVAIVDLSQDGSPEIVFATYSSEEGNGRLIVLSASGAELHSIPLTGRGAMSVPTIDDVDGDGTLEIVISLKDAIDRESSVLVYSVPGSATNCMPWPTGRRDYLRDGWVP